MVVIKNESLKKATAFFIKNEKAVKWAAFSIFVILTFIVGTFHEPWADEAQSWLIARDTNFIELFQIMAYEGSPSLWQMILKVFIFFGLPYRYIFIIPVLFSSVGMWLLIFKSKLPLHLAVILPFTYYLFYQYTIITRSYCLILPFMQLIILAFPNRLKRPFFYGLLLVLFSGICIHTALLSGVLFLLFCIDIIKNLRKAEKAAQNVKALISAVFVLLSYLLTILYIKPPIDYSFPAHFNFDIRYILLNFTDLFGNLVVYNAKTVLYSVIMIVIIVSFLLLYKISIRFLIISTAIWGFLSVFYFNQWHIGIILLSFLLAFQLYPPKPNEKKTLNKCKPYFKAAIGIFVFVQLVWSANTALYDVSNPYTGARAAAEFIKENHYDRQVIYGFGYNATALEPYFESNIFKNRTKDNTYYIWSEENGNLTIDQVLSALPPLLVFSEFDDTDYADIEEIISALGYQRFEFEGASYIKTDVYESQTYFVYVNQQRMTNRIYPLQ